ncbi:MAG TPA: alpha/beta hydrolase [Acidimicrobiales bacterium]|nr:alpha/beta hydrolase [Acidimicrobiales bacterium]
MSNRLIAALGLGAAGAVAASALTYRRWAAQPEPEGGAVGVLEGTDGTVETADGTTIAYTEAGEPGGPPVVLVHGWTEDRRVWSPVARRLAQAGRRVIAYDQRGHGASGVGRDGYTIDALADDLRAVLEGLDLHEVTVAGHSMGGMAAQALAVRHPETVSERVAGLVLVSTAASDLGVGARRERQAAWLFANAGFQRAISHPTVGPLLTRGAAGRRPYLSHLRATADMLANTSVATRTGFLTAMGRLDLTGGLGGIKVPVTILVGSRDQLTPVAASRRIASLINGAHLDVVPDAGHMLTLERPELVARWILDTPGLTSASDDAVNGQARVDA